jgi:hypothetical protein
MTLSNKLLYIETNLINWKFNKNNIFFNKINNNYKFNLKLYKKKFTCFFIIDVFFNKININLLNKLNKIVIGNPITKYFYRLFYWSVLPTFLFFNTNLCYMLDYFSFKFLIYSYKLSNRLRLIK